MRTAIRQGTLETLKLCELLETPERDNQQPSPMKSKVCTSCKEEKPVTEFYSVKVKGNLYLRGRCKKCEHLHTQEYRRARPEWAKSIQKRAYDRNPDQFRKKARESYAKNRVARLAQKKSRREEIKKALIYRYSNGTNKCACCGESEYTFLSLDHISNDGAKHRREFGGRSNYDGDDYYKALLEGEYDINIQVLCMNCNWGKHRNNGVCPHREGSTTIPSGSTAQVNGAGSAERRKAKI